MDRRHFTAMLLSVMAVYRLHAAPFGTTITGPWRLTNGSVYRVTYDVSNWSPRERQRLQHFFDDVLRRGGMPFSLPTGERLRVVPDAVPAIPPNTRLRIVDVDVKHSPAEDVSA